MGIAVTAGRRSRSVIVCVVGIRTCSLSCGWLSLGGVCGEGITDRGEVFGIVRIEWDQEVTECGCADRDVQERPIGAGLDGEAGGVGSQGDGIGRFDLLHSGSFGCRGGVSGSPATAASVQF